MDISSVLHSRVRPGQLSSDRARGSGYLSFYPKAKLQLLQLHYGKVPSELSTSNPHQLQRGMFMLPELKGSFMVNSATTAEALQIKKLTRITRINQGGPGTLTEA